MVDGVAVFRDSQGDCVISVRFDAVYRPQLAVQFFHCRDEITRRELHCISVPDVELNVWYCRGESVLGIATGGGRIAQGWVTQTVGHQHVH